MTSVRPARAVSGHGAPFREVGIVLAGSERRSVGPAGSLRFAAALTADGPVAARRTDSGTHDASDHVRRLLAAARRVLEAHTASAPQPALRLAGLMRFDGSDRWSLADTPKREA